MDHPDCGTSGGPGRIKQQALVGMLYVVVLDKLGEYCLEVLLIADDQMPTRLACDTSLTGAGSPTPSNSYSPAGPPRRHCGVITLHRHYLLRDRS